MRRASAPVALSFRDADDGGLEADQVARDGEHFLWAQTTNDAIPAVRHHFAEIRDLHLPATELDVRVERVGTDTAAVTVAARGYAYMVRIPSPVPELRIEANLFDLPNGHTRRVLVRNVPADLDLNLLNPDAFPTRTAS
ncbi:MULTISPECIES: hypothetical protein [unclassified Microbacterium]|uniref:hypothetical protein n=1 Tax=unclassified Microbacterium TaxID=2609290 RepID=UPI00246852DE|nr:MULTISPECIES: hypothetical protein [unclassified Microbacterium]MDH5134554.1 hypothetical protein [Microbacterium sp. RD10]MDH5136968.1 hypothetical protein [Microbacterium sp. RD11]MDH5145998.1 hypothetical protein [Microbacterium sp. RD12]MDH5153356.1 hypothetical protein [Microbacterium sp. RD06]MDH5167412.1 hypothetical protein [Microbacterium sp. RD02]